MVQEIEESELPQLQISGQLAFNPMTEEEILAQKQHPTRIGKPERKEYQLFIGLYQARNLIASDETGLSDPYVAIQCCVITFKSEIITKRLNPFWNKGYLLDVTLPHPVCKIPVSDQIFIVQLHGLLYICCR